MMLTIAIANTIMALHEMLKYCVISELDIKQVSEIHYGRDSSKVNVDSNCTAMEKRIPIPNKLGIGI